MSIAETEKMDAPDEKVELSPFVADVFTAMFAQSEATTNAVFDNYERTIAELRRDFVTFFTAVEKIAVRNDSASLNYLLDDNGYKFETAMRGLDKAAN